MPVRSCRDRRGWLAVLLLLTTGCGGEDGRQPWTEDLLPSGAVRITNPGEGTWSANNHWRLVPEIVLGELGASREEQFARITGLQVGRDGQIYVLDGGLNELRIFSAEGQHLRTVGRPGEGPGEYRSANGLLWLDPDSLVVVDQRGDRFTVLDSDGQYVRSVPRGLGTFGIFAGGLEGDRVYDVLTVLGPTGEAVLALVGVSLRATGGPGTPDTIYLPMPEAPVYESFSVQSSLGGMSIPVPFAASAAYHLDGRGHLWHGHGSEFRFFQSTLAGDTVREVRVDAVPAPVTSMEISQWEAGDDVARFRERGGQPDRDRIPLHKPFLDDLYVDPDGFVWAGVPASPGESEFAVFDPEGRFLGRLKLEGATRDRSVSPVVRGDRLYFVGTSQLDVPQVLVLAMERDG